MMFLSEVIDTASPYIDSKELVQELCKAIIEQGLQVEDEVAHKIFDRVLVPLGKKSGDLALARMRKIH
jgi:hypothetical protein